jgi:hypothetical protein
MAEVVNPVVQSVTKEKGSMAGLMSVVTPILIILGVILIIIGILIQVGIIKQKKPSKSNTLQSDLAVTPYNQSLSYPVNSLPSNQQYLVNFSPLTGYMAGYIGPIKGGTFNPNVYLTAAFHAGIRSFVLPISQYIDNNKTPDNGFPYSGHPSVVCRDASGTIISTNGMSVIDFINALLQTRGVNSYYANEPIFLFLEEVPGSIPDPVKEENKYVRLMNKIADDLSPLDSNNSRVIQMDGFGHLGSLVGGEREKELATLIPAANYFGKILIFTNFKTHLSNKPAYQKLPQKKLHEYVNFVYKSGADATIRANQAAKSISITDVNGSQVNWVNATQSTFYIAESPTPLEVPDVKLINTALTQGIQFIPIPFFFQPPAATKAIFDLWKGGSARVKPVSDPEYNLFTRPDPIVPAQPSQTMNARVSPDAQPGQVFIR